MSLATNQELFLSHNQVSVASVMFMYAGPSMWLGPRVDELSPNTLAAIEIFFDKIYSLLFVVS